jgi:hypothetical protein
MSLPSPTANTDGEVFRSIEDELRELDDDFQMGRMNAFGTAATHDEIMKEIKKISDLELQIFYRTVDAVKTAIEEEPIVNRLLTNHTDLSAVLNEDMRAEFEELGGFEPSAASPAQPTSPSQVGMDFLSGSLHARRENRGGQSEGSPSSPADRASAESSAESMMKATDRSFEEVARTFRNRQVAMKAIGENLRQMSRHVANVNDLNQRAHAMPNFGQ